MAATEIAIRLQIKGDYFENCDCDLVCRCLFSPNAPLASSPTEGPCELPIVFHIDEGRFGEPGEELLWVSNAHPFALSGLALAVGEESSAWSDYEMSWDNSGKNSHFATIDWSNG